MKKLLSRLTLCLVAPQMIMSGTFAQSSLVDLSARLTLREKFYTTFLEVQRDMNDIQKTEALKVWYGVKAKEYRLPKYRLSQTQALKNSVYSQDVIDWAGHYQATGQFEKTAAVLSSYFYMVAAFINELSTDPRDDGSMTKVKKAAQGLADSSLAAAIAAEQCLSKSAPTAGSLSQLASACLNNPGLQAATGLVTTALQEKFYTGSNQVLSLTGLIPGNKVEQILENFYEPEFIKYMAPMTEAVIKNYAEMDVAAFKAKMSDRNSALTNFFTVAEGFPAKARDHKVWNATKEFVNSTKPNIYGQIMTAIDNAKQSVFIDVFFLGGSIGATLSKRLIEKVQENKNFWVYIINDRNNPLGYDKEMAPVYNYLRAYAEKFAKDRIVLVTPQVELKRTAFPPIADLIMKDSTLLSIMTEGQRKGLIGQLSFYPKGKSDHSKVVIVDGLDKTNGTAFVGSKNFTDSSGGVAYDEVTKIQGPAVAAILDSYYYDLSLAVKNLLNPKSIFSNPQYLADLYSENFADGEKNVDVQVKKILSKVDVLNRSKLSGVTDLKWDVKGSTPIMIGENNAYGTIRTALPQVIAAIRSADKQIIISEQFIYEPSVVRALKEQVAKRNYLGATTPFKVYILLADMADHFNPMKEFSHIPNVSFVDQFSATGSNIQVKWKKVPPSHLKALSEVRDANKVNFAPEYHLKSISIDGVTAAEAGQCGNQDALTAGLASTSPTKLPLLISGSANKDVMTMTGGFREYQVVVYDRAVTVAHDCQFWSRFNNPDQSQSVDVKSMNLPASLKDKGINETRFNQLVRDIVDGSYNVMTGYFGN